MERKVKTNMEKYDINVLRRRLAVEYKLDPDSATWSDIEQAARKEERIWEYFDAYFSWMKCGLHANLAKAIADPEGAAPLDAEAILKTLSEYGWI